MHLKFNSPVLLTNKLERLKPFYTDILKISVELDFGACILLKCGLSLWQLSDQHKLAQHLGYQSHKDGNKNLELVFETDDFEKDVTELKTKKISLLHDVTVESWGQKTIRFYDPDKNLIELGETIPCFIKRMYKEGMTIEDIASKTSVPINLVKEYTR